MAKREKIPIRTQSFIRVGEELVNTDMLTEEQAVHFATKLKESYMNALFIGKAEFSAEIPAVKVFQRAEAAT